MQCPICGSYEQKSTEMKSEQFCEELVECAICGSNWSINHGRAVIVSDPQLSTFLQGQSECVEGDDYTWAA